MPAADPPPVLGDAGVLHLGRPSHLDPSQLARLPGMAPFDPADWLRPDDAFAGQMALRDRLIAERAEDVHAALPGSADAARELLDEALGLLPRHGYRLSATEILRPDGVGIPLDRAAPLLTLGRLVQDDLCLLERQGDDDVLVAAILCFPADWTLAQKIGRPMLRIHAPVARYDADVARRVGRLFEALMPGRPICRINAHPCADPTLYTPRPEFAPKPRDLGNHRFLRSELQVLLRLPQTRAVVFSIRTRMYPLGAWPEVDAAVAHRATYLR